MSRGEISVSKNWTSSLGKGGNKGRFFLVAFVFNQLKHNTSESGVLISSLEFRSILKGGGPRCRESGTGVFFSSGWMGLDRCVAVILAPFEVVLPNSGDFLFGDGSCLSA